MSRGDLRGAILLLLAERTMNGYQMIQELEARTQGIWRPSPGTIYPALRRLRDEGLITARDADTKRLFSLTGAGEADARRRASAQSPWQELAELIDPTVLELRNAAGRLNIVVLRLARTGTEEQQVRALELLADVPRRLYRILASDR